MRSPLYGGKACPTLDATKECNTHSCQLGVCHNEHVKCVVTYQHYGRKNSACKGAGCDVCDDELECQAKKLVRTLSVIHDKKFQYVEGAFKCSIVDSDGSVVFRKHLIPESRKKCVCRCSHHPLSCFYAGKVLSNGAIDGSVLANIGKMEDCSNLCSHHPDCGSWEYDSNHQCILSSGTPSFINNTNPLVHTWAGAKSGSTGCVQQKVHLSCPIGKYRQIGDEVGEEAFKCLNCENGKTSHMNDALSCEIELKTSAEECPDGQYIAMRPTTTYRKIAGGEKLPTNWEGGDAGGEGGDVDKAICLTCASGRWSSAVGDHECHDVVQLFTRDTRVPTASPTFAPTEAPTQALCIDECASDMGHGNLHAECLACKGHMNLVDFCATYPTISGC